MEFAWKLCSEQALPLYALQELRRGRLAAIVTLRGGGFSAGPFERLNLSFKVGDVPLRVRKNRGLLASTLGLREQDCAWPEQVHGDSVANADSPGEFKGADGLVSTRPELWIAILVADCVPVFVMDDELSTVGLAHAGRLGTALGITKNLIAAVGAESGVPPRRLIVALGPSIGPCCYELDSITASNLPDTCVEVRDGKVFFDLWKANALQAMARGIAEENIVLPPACTCCKQEMFFSHRAHSGRTGRQMAITSAGGLRCAL